MKKVIPTVYTGEMTLLFMVNTAKIVTPAMMNIAANGMVIPDASVKHERINPHINPWGNNDRISMETL